MNIVEHSNVEALRAENPSMAAWVDQLIKERDVALSERSKMSVEMSGLRRQIDRYNEETQDWLRELVRYQRAELDQ